MSGMDYKSSGVNVSAGENAVKSIKPLVRKTYNQNVLSDLGVFGGFYQLDLERWKRPVLISSTDGVGTKLIVAQMAEEFETIGEDIVNHCVDDIFVHAAHPQFFMDYIGIGRIESSKIEKIVSGMSKACIENEMSLIGGEMAEMPEIYGDKHFDIVGTIVGLVEKDGIINGETIQDGDVIIGYPSTGLHTNGYTLARKILFEKLQLKVDSMIPNMNKSVAEALLAVHKSYYPLLKNFAKPELMHGMAHITGGGIVGNLKRIIPEGLNARIIENSWETPALFKVLQDAGKISNSAMFEAFNMGIGFVVVVPESSRSLFLENTSGIELGRVSADTGLSKVEILF